MAGDIGRAGFGTRARAMQYLLWGIVGGALLLAVASGWAEHRRRNRVDLDRVGVVPWPLIQFLALMAAMLAAGIAWRIG